MTPADARSDAELRARLAATPLREPTPEHVRHWQAVLRELPAPRRHGRWASGPLWPGELSDWASEALSDVDVDPVTAAASNREARIPASLEPSPTAVTTNHEALCAVSPEMSAPVGFALNALTDESRHSSLAPADRGVAETAGTAPSGWPPGYLAPISDSLDEIPEGHGPAVESLRAAVEGPPADDQTIFVDRSAAAAGEVTTFGNGPTQSFGPPLSKLLRLITEGARSTPLSSDSDVPPFDAAKSANIGISIAQGLAAMATRPLNTVDADMAMAKMRRTGPPSRVAAAVAGLAAAIIAVAVMGPSPVSHPPSAATPGHSSEGSAATAGSSRTGPTATAAGSSQGLDAYSPTTRPTDTPATHPTDIPGTRPTDTPPTRPTEPLVLSRGQLGAVPPTGRDLGPLAAPAKLSGCLARFGATEQPVAARRVVLDGRPGVLLVLPTDLPGRLRLLVVDPRCSSALSDEVVGR